jgi:hypothetical protein
MAVDFENDPACHQKYPPNLVVHSLLSFALISAEKIEEIYESFQWIFADHPVARAFSMDDYEGLVSKILKDAKCKNSAETDDLIRALFGRVHFDQLLPNPLTYVNTFYVHDNIKIPYPNCGETSLLNFFYYLWGDRGIINPAYIEETEKKLSDKENANWKKLKEYFLKFSTIGSSASELAQIDWSNLISNLNEENTHSSLRIIYREKVCNVQGIGIFNMLNVFEKIIPDNALSVPFEGNSAEILEQASQKFDRLADLFSRSGVCVDWHSNKSKKFYTKIVDIVFTVNGEDRFEWNFKSDSFDLGPVQNNNQDWRQNCAWENMPLLLKSWVKAIAPKLQHRIDNPSEIYALNLLDPKVAVIAIDKIMEQKWLHLKSLVPQIIGKTLFVDDKEAQRNIYILLHYNKGIIDGHYYSEFDWKTHIPNFVPVSKEYSISKAARMGCWNVLKNYSIKNNRKKKTHFTACKKGCLPFVKYILDQNPNELNDIYYENPNLISIAVNEGHFDIIDYLLSFFKDINDCKNEFDEGLMKLFLSSSYDMTCYIEKLLENRLNLNIFDSGNSNFLYDVSEKSNIKNIKLFIDKTIEDYLSLKYKNN